VEDLLLQVKEMLVDKLQVVLTMLLLVVEVLVVLVVMQAIHPILVMVE
jgi:hypothetical protein